MADKRLIDANALYDTISDVASSAHHDVMSAENVLELIDTAHAVDAVPVVRCKDCKHAIVNENHIDKPLICCLTKMCGTTKEDWFCAAGERKMDGGAFDGNQ